MLTAKFRKELSFVCWGALGVLSVLLFFLAPMSDSDEPYLWAGAGIFGVLLCLGGHSLTCGAIDRLSRR